MKHYTYKGLETYGVLCIPYNGVETCPWLETYDVLARTLGPQGGGLWDATLVGEGNEIFLISVWKPFHGGRGERNITYKGVETYSVSENVGPLKGVDCEIQTFLIRV